MSKQLDSDRGQVSAYKTETTALSQKIRRQRPCAVMRPHITADDDGLVPLELTLPRAGGGSAERNSACAVASSRCKETQPRCSISNVEQKRHSRDLYAKFGECDHGKGVPMSLSYATLLYQEPAARTGDARSTSGMVIRGYLACTKPQQKSVLFSKVLSTLSVNNGVGLTTDCNCRTDLGIAIKNPHGLAKATSLATFAWASGTTRTWFDSCYQLVSCSRSRSLPISANIPIGIQ